MKPNLLKYPRLSSDETSSLPLLSRIAEHTRTFLPRWSIKRSVAAGSVDRPWRVLRWDADGNRILAGSFANRREALGYVAQLNEEEHLRLIFTVLENLFAEEPIIISDFLRKTLNEAPLCPPVATFRTSIDPSPQADNGPGSASST